MNAFSLFLCVLFIWIVAALWTGTLIAEDFPLIHNFETHLAADYGFDVLGRSLKTLRLAIFGEIFQDSNPPQQKVAFIHSLLQGPVPTATFPAGAIAPTPSETAVWTPTSVQPATSTPLPQATNTELPKVVHTDTPVPTSGPAATLAPTKTQEILQLKPILECVQDNGDGSYTAYFGYKNFNAFKVAIPIGDMNYFSPEPSNRNQVTNFEPGRSPSYPDASFAVLFDGNDLVWHLEGMTSTASSSSTPCAPPPTPTSSPIPEDNIDPEIKCGNIDPSPGELCVCEVTIQVSQLHVIDSPPSSGLNYVKLKYNVDGFTEGYIYSEPLSICGGGPTEGGGWDGYYCGSIYVEIDPSWEPSDDDPFNVNLWAKVGDNAGNTAYKKLGSYTMPARCGCKAD